MTKIRLKSVSRKTRVSRARVRKAIARLSEAKKKVVGRLPTKKTI